MGRRVLPAKTLELIDRAEAGDREACYDLARLYKPVTVSEFVDFVKPDQQVPTGLFDALADAYAAYSEAA